MPIPLQPPRSAKSKARALGAALFLASTTGCSLPSLNGDGDAPYPDGTFTDMMCKSDAQPLARSNYGVWNVVRLDDVVPGDEQFVCADGSPYKFFVQFQQDATDLTVTFEPGGGCWDYATCTNDAGVLRARRLGQIPDNLMTQYRGEGAMPWAALYPHLGRVDNSVATNKYNHVFFPYCTADGFTGDIQNTYEQPGSEPLTIQHRGRRNILAAMPWLAHTFPTGQVGQLFVSGGSAGAIGTMVNYASVRDTTAPQCSALVSDSGPIFTPGGKQTKMMNHLSEVWGLRQPGALAEQLDERFGTATLVTDFGNINGALSRAFPDDRFLMTSFRQDLNFSVFSFAGSGVVAPGPNFAERLIEAWDEELHRFKTFADESSLQNWGYYFPAFRRDECSHVVAMTAATKMGDSEFVEAGLDGRADAYFGTEVGPPRQFSKVVWNDDPAVSSPTRTINVTRRMHFGDALRQLLDRSAPLPREVGEPEADDLTYISGPEGTSADETWYGGSYPDGFVIQDKAAWLAGALARCASVGNYVAPN
jgi:hypothetical protein